MNSAIAMGVTILIGLFYCWTSRLNGLFFFGRTADAETRATDEARAITREYRMRIVLTTIIAVGMARMGGSLGVRGLAASGVLLEIVAFAFIFARANRQARRLVQQRGPVAKEAVIQVALLEQPTYWIPGLGAVLLPLALSAAAVCAAVLSAAPGTGWNAGWTALGNSMDGQGYSMTLGLATGMLASAGTMLLLFRSSARLRTKMAQYTVRASFSLEWIATALMIGLLTCNHFGVTMTRSVGRGVTLATIVTALAVMLWNQGRYKRFVPPPVELGADDRWRWGLFYVDRADPALFVQSRCGAGYTLNYGRVAAWPISLAVVAYLVGTIFFLPHHH